MDRMPTQRHVRACDGSEFGLICAVRASSLLRSLLFGVQAWDRATLTEVVGSLGVASIAASLLPAQRAVSVNPVDALRVE